MYASHVDNNHQEQDPRSDARWLRCFRPVRLDHTPVLFCRTQIEQDTSVAVRFAGCAGMAPVEQQSVASDRPLRFWNETAEIDLDLVGVI